MIHYQPVEFLGSIHTKSTGNSYERFKELNLKVGDIISVTYVNDVMPRVSALPELEKNISNPEKPFEFPSVCPECGNKLIESESGKSMYCTNIHCKGRAYKRMESTMAKLGIKDFAYESIKALEITSLHELMMASEEKLSILGPNDKYNLKSQLIKLEKEPIYDYKLIGSLGFKDTAIKTFRLFFEHYDLNDFTEWFDQVLPFEEVCEQFIWIKGIGAKTLYTIYNEYPHFEKDIMYCIKHFNIVPYKLENHQVKEIVFTGFRDQELTQKLNDLGFDADPNNNLKKETYLLIIPNENFTSSKIAKARKYGIKIMTAQEVMRCINERINF